MHRPDVSARILAGLLLLLPGLLRSRDTPPDFGPNVLIFDPAMTDIQSRINALFARRERSEFGPGRVAYLFKPGEYHLDVQMGFCMQALGLGRSPDEVGITGAVRSKADWARNHNATVNFWRGAENLAVTPTLEDKVNVWAVSQGTALRRVHFHGNVALWDGGWASGGFMADCKIDGQVNSGTQQQWLSRNADWGRWIGSSWNMVFVGVAHPPEGRWPSPPYTVVEQTPLSREKPYLFIDAAGDYFVFVPDLATDTKGITWAAGPTPGRALPISQFYLARPERDNAATINAALRDGRDLILTPGIYHLETSVEVTRPETVVLGLGYATLVPDRGTPALTIADVEGVKIGGLLLEAGPVNSPVLLQVGPAVGGADHAANPVFLYDIFCRATTGTADCFVTINSNNVVGDNLWLWRADHGPGAAWTVNRNAHGLIVNGNDVTLYGLFVEHTQEYQTLWNGNGGRVYFYQSEIPYDPPSQAAWMNGTVRGFASYKVAANVTRHEAWGVGVYSVFHEPGVILENAIETPDVPGVKIHHMVTLRLGLQTTSGINHIINGRGNSVITAKMARLDESQPP